MFFFNERLQVYSCFIRMHESYCLCLQMWFPFCFDLLLLLSAPSAELEPLQDEFAGPMHVAAFIKRREMTTFEEEQVIALCSRFQK